MDSSSLISNAFTGTPMATPPNKKAMTAFTICSAVVLIIGMLLVQYMFTIELELRDYIAGITIALLEAYNIAELDSTRRVILPAVRVLQVGLGKIEDNLSSLSARVNALELKVDPKQQSGRVVESQHGFDVPDTFSNGSDYSAFTNRLLYLEHQDRTRNEQIEQALVRVSQLEGEKLPPRANPLATFDQIRAQRDELPTPSIKDMAVMAATWPILERHHAELWDRFKGLQREISKLQASRTKQETRIVSLERAIRGYTARPTLSDDEGANVDQSLRYNNQSGHSNAWHSIGYPERGGTPRRGGYRGGRGSSGWA